MIIKGAQPATRALLSIQPVTSYASLIRAGTRVEGPLQGGHFPTLSAMARQANNPSSSNRRSSSNNNDSATSYSQQHAIAYVDSPSKPAYVESQPDSTSLDYAHDLVHTAHTATVEPVHHIAPARQGLQPRQRRPCRAECDYTPLAEPLSVIFP